MTKYNSEEAYPPIKYDPNKKKIVRSSVKAPKLAEEHLFAAEMLLGILSEFYDCEAGDFFLKTKKRKICNARFNFYFLMKIEFRKELTFRSLGSFFPSYKKEGFGQDHATVMNAISKHGDLKKGCKSYLDLSNKVKMKWIEEYSAVA